MEIWKIDKNFAPGNIATDGDVRHFALPCAPFDLYGIFYDGEEGIPGIPMNGTLTLSENVADNGAAACVTEIVAGLEKENKIVNKSTKIKEIYRVDLLRNNFLKIFIDFSLSSKYGYLKSSSSLYLLGEIDKTSFNFSFSLFRE